MADECEIKTAMKRKSRWLQPKKELLSEISQLSQKLYDFEMVLSNVICEGKMAEAVSKRLRAGHPVETVAEWIMNPIPDPNIDNSQKAPDIPQMRGPWTTVTSDMGLVNHLLSLYFCWEHPIFAPFSKEHFLADLWAFRLRYCSPILVNAILAMGCRFSTNPSTPTNLHDHDRRGDHFFAECLRLYQAERDHHTLTTVQALGIISIRQASCGRCVEGWFYAQHSIKLAVEMGLHRLPDAGVEDEEREVRSATF